MAGLNRRLIGKRHGDSGGADGTGESGGDNKFAGAGGAENFFIFL